MPFSEFASDSLIASLPSTLWAQLHTSNPGSVGTSNISTTSTRHSFTLTSPSSGMAENTADIQWPSFSTSGGSETLTHISVWDASTGGDCWFIHNFGSRLVLEGELVEIAAGALRILLPHWS